MALLFAENGCDVFLRDPSNEAMEKVLDQAKKDNVAEKLSKYQDNESLCKVRVCFHSSGVFCSLEAFLACCVPLRKSI